MLDWQLKQPARVLFRYGVTATFTIRIITELTMVHLR